jgi:hypothetical protein
MDESVLTLPLYTPDAVSLIHEISSRALGRLGCDSATRATLPRRAANRKALKPLPIRQAKLHFAAIPETHIKEACERFNLSLETWTRQERALVY